MPVLPMSAHMHLHAYAALADGYAAPFAAAPVVSGHQLETPTVHVHASQQWSPDPRPLHAHPPMRPEHVPARTGRIAQWRGLHNCCVLGMMFKHARLSPHSPHQFLPPAPLCVTHVFRSFACISRVPAIFPIAAALPSSALTRHCQVPLSCALLPSCAVTHVATRLHAGKATRLCSLTNSTAKCRSHASPPGAAHTRRYQAPRLHGSCRS